MNIYHLPQCLWAGTQGWLIRVVLSQGSHEVTVKLLVKAASSEAWTRAGRSTSEVAAYTPGQWEVPLSRELLQRQWHRGQLTFPQSKGSEESKAEATYQRYLASEVAP